MHNLVVFVGHLKRIVAFEICVKTIVFILMIAGMWVATRSLDMPSSLSFNDKFIHVFVFFSFALLMDLAIAHMPFWFKKGLPLLIYGAGIEVLQYFSPNRSFELLDWLADFTGVLLYFLIRTVFLWLDTKRLSKSKY